MSFLEIYEEKRRYLYDQYHAGRINLEEYLKRIRPIDRWIDRLEMGMIPGMIPWGREDASPSRSKGD
jgi:hypothetical protein